MLVVTICMQMSLVMDMNDVVRVLSDMRSCPMRCKRTVLNLLACAVLHCHQCDHTLTELFTMLE